MADHLKYNIRHGSMNQTSYDAGTYKNIDEICQLMKQLKPISENGARELWLKVPRGSIEDFGDYEEMLENGEVENYDDFVRYWQDSYPNEYEWLSFGVVETEEGYKGIFLEHYLALESDPRRQKTEYTDDYSEFSAWLLDEVKRCIAALKAGTYNEDVRENLPAKHRTGYITRKDLWDIFPESREDFFKDFSKEDARAFQIHMNHQEKHGERPLGRLPSLTANEFYQYCSLGYKANNYRGIELSPKEQYYLHADGRDEGFGEIDPDNPEAFYAWFHDHSHWGGHPWEVCRGGNSTHISLYPRYDDGWYFALSGDAWNRTIETIKFYLALRRDVIPVYLYSGPLLVKRIFETEKIGIVPSGIFPAYCNSMFDDKEIIDFMNLPFEKTNEVAAKCVWYDIPEAELLEVTWGQDT